MKREPYRLHEYFNQLKSREEITTAELRSLVERVTEEGEKSLSKHGGIIMTAVVVLCSLALGGGIFWQTGISESAQTPPIDSNTLHITTATKQDRPDEVGISTQNTQTQLVDNDQQKEQSHLTENNGKHEDRLNNSLAKLLKTPWGYRLQPGQKLWYEYRVLETDPYNGDTTISIERACIEVEKVDQQGNLRLLFTTTVGADIEESEKQESNLLSKKYRATISPLGEFISGNIVDTGAVQHTELKEVEQKLLREGIQQEVQKWFPRWPAQKNFNAHLQARERREWLDTNDAVAEENSRLRISRNQKADQYLIDSTSLGMESPTVRIATGSSNESMYRQENQDELTRDKSEGKLTFNKNDGSVVDQVTEGSYFHSTQQTVGKSFMKRNETMTIRSTSLHRVNADEAEESQNVVDPHLD